MTNENKTTKSILGLLSKECFIDDSTVDIEQINQLETIQAYKDYAQCKYIAYLNDKVIMRSSPGTIPTTSLICDDGVWSGEFEEKAK